MELRYARWCWLTLGPRGCGHDKFHSKVASPALADHMVKIAREEIEFAKRQYAIAREDSTIAFEASNHYYYRPLDLVEKVLNCHYIINALKTGVGS